MNPAICLEPPYLLFGASKSWIMRGIEVPCEIIDQVESRDYSCSYFWCSTAGVGWDMMSFITPVDTVLEFLFCGVACSFLLDPDIQFSRTSGFLPNNLSSLRHVNCRACNIRDTIFTGNKRTAEWHFRNRGVRVPSLLRTIDTKRATRHKLVCPSPFLLIFKQMFWLDWHLCSFGLCMPQASNL
jgi:hypothetical protein